jgi:hypothetical protein
MVEVCLSQTEHVQAVVLYDSLSKCNSPMSGEKCHSVTSGLKGTKTESQPQKEVIALRFDPGRPHSTASGSPTFLCCSQRWCQHQLYLEVYGKTFKMEDV